MRKFTAAAGLTSSGIDLDRVRGALPRVDPGLVAVREAPGWFRAMWASGIVAVAMPWGVYFSPAMMDRLECGDQPLRLGRLLVHELTHIEQFRRLGGARHITQYLSDYMRGRLQRKGHWGSYQDIRLEVEARLVAQRVVAGPR